MTANRCLSNFELDKCLRLLEMLESETARYPLPVSGFQDFLGESKHNQMMCRLYWKEILENWYDIMGYINVVEKLGVKMYQIRKGASEAAREKMKLKFQPPLFERGFEEAVS
jgi:hypothetical protein